MGKRTERAKATREVWREALAEQLLCGGAVRQTPVRRGLNRPQMQCHPQMECHPFR